MKGVSSIVGHMSDWEGHSAGLGDSLGLTSSVDDGLGIFGFHSPCRKENRYANVFFIN